MKKPRIIYYVGGCYGTFIEWSCNYFEKNNSITKLPFTANGSSHQFIGNFFPYYSMIKEYVNSSNLYPYCRSHPGLSSSEHIDVQTSRSYYDMHCSDIQQLEKLFDQILVVYPTENTKFWISNNVIDKCRLTFDTPLTAYQQHFAPYDCADNFQSKDYIVDLEEKIRYILKKELAPGTTSQWGKESIDNLDIWELRELLSFYWHNRVKDFYTCWSPLVQEFSNNNIKFISVDKFKDDFSATVNEYLDFFNVVKIENFDQELKSIEQHWKTGQIHINKDCIIDTIISSILTDTYCQWDKLTIIDEAHIQKTLRDHHYEIQCDGLNMFPTNTDELQKILYRI